MSKKRRNKGTCTYCGKVDIITKDHIPPECLFAKPRPSNLITVPSCKKCHRQTTKDDEYFKTVLSLTDLTKDHPDIQSILPSVMRSLDRPSKIGFRKSLLSRSFLINVRTPSGIFLGKRPAFRPDGERLMRVIKRIVRGLYLHENGQRMINSVDIRGDILDTSDLGSVYHNEMFQNLFLPAFQKAEKKVFGNNVFTYWSLIAEDNPYATAWLMIFYDKIGFCAFSAPYIPVN